MKPAPDAAPNALAGAWESLWRSETADEITALWAPEPTICTFVPFDTHQILNGLEAIVQHLLARRAADRLIWARWKEAVMWLDGPIEVSFARLEFGLAGIRDNRDAEARHVHFLAAAQRQNGQIRLRHLAEAPPAALIEMLADYQSHARLSDDAR